MADDVEIWQGGRIDHLGMAHKITCMLVDLLMEKARPAYKRVYSEIFKMS